ncbi:MAG TPA: cupin domain-containing protein [Dongiaceae bacterium]
MSELKVIRFEPQLPAGRAFPCWPDMPADSLESGSPVQSGHVYFEDAGIGLSAGVWECTAFTSRLEPYPVHEFMLLLEGEVTIVEAGGRETTVKAGESFVIPRGLPCRWVQKSKVKKYYVIYEPKDEAANASSASQVIKPDHHRAPKEPSPPPPSEVLNGPVPEQHGQDCYVDPSGRFQIGTWDTSYYHRKVVPFPRYELMHFLEGGVSTTDAAGNTQSFKAGDTLFIPMGARADFKVAGDYLRKIYVIFAPGA